MNKKIFYIFFHALVVVSFSMVIGMQLGVFIPTTQGFDNARRVISLTSLLTMMMLSLVIVVTIYIVYDTSSRIVSLLSSEQKKQSYLGYKGIPLLMVGVIFLGTAVLGTIQVCSFVYFMDSDKTYGK